MPPAPLRHPIVLSLFSPGLTRGVIWFTGTRDIPQHPSENTRLRTQTT